MMQFINFGLQLYSKVYHVLAEIVLGEELEERPRELLPASSSNEKEKRKCKTMNRLVRRMY
jgi:hypothetical protein